MTYALYLHETAFEFLLALAEDECSVLLHELRSLRKNPFLQPDFIEDANEGVISGKVISLYAILYHVDHAVKHVWIADITYADKV